jgi:hypothetical protein
MEEYSSYSLKRSIREYRASGRNEKYFGAHWYFRYTLRFIYILRLYEYLEIDHNRLNKSDFKRINKYLHKDVLTIKSSKYNIKKEYEWHESFGRKYVIYSVRIEIKDHVFYLFHKQYLLDSSCYISPYELSSIDYVKDHNLFNYCRNKTNHYAYVYDNLIKFKGFYADGYDFFVKRFLVNIRRLYNIIYLKRQNKIQQLRRIEERIKNKITEHVRETKNQKTYIMLDSHTGYYKIGYSSNPGVRESTLLSQKPTISLLYIHPKNIEKKLHKNYSDFRVRGEWFNLNQDQLNEIITTNSFKRHSI